MSWMRFCVCVFAVLRRSRRGFVQAEPKGSARCADSLSIPLSWPLVPHGALVGAVVADGAEYRIVTWYNLSICKQAELAVAGSVWSEVGRARGGID